MAIRVVNPTSSSSANGGGILVSRDRSRVADAYPSVMSSPPALTMSAANAATSISGTVTNYAFSSGGTLSSNFTFIGKHVVVSGADVAAAPLGVGTPVGYAGQPGVTRIEFMTDAPQFEIGFRGTGSSYRIRINGQLTDSSGLRSDGAGSNGSLFRLLVDFSGVVAPRRITVEGFNPGIAPALRQITIPAIYGLWPSSIGGPKMVVVGDSYIVGSSIPSADGGGPASFAFALGQVIGMPNCVQSGIPGTGHVNTVSGTRPTYIQHVADVVAEAPDLIIDWGSINDKTFSGVGTARTAYWAALKASLPNAVIIATSPFDYNGASSANIIANVRDPSKTAATAEGIPFIDMMGTLSGTGYIGNAQGDGNRDRYIGSDNTHPFLDGNKFITGFLAPAVEKALLGTRLS